MKKDNKQFRKFLYDLLYWSEELSKVTKDPTRLEELQEIKGDCIQVLGIPA